MKAKDSQYKFAKSPMSEKFFLENVHSVLVIFLHLFCNSFKIEQKLDFKEALFSLNVTEIFSGGCDLSGITGMLLMNNF